MSHSFAIPTGGSLIASFLEGTVMTTASAGGAAASNFTEVASATATSDVASLSTGTISLDATKTYLCVIGVDGQAGVTQVKVYANGDTTDANYTRGYRNSSGSGADASLPSEMNIASGGQGVFQSFLMTANSIVKMLSTSGGAAANTFVEVSSAFSNGKSSFTEISINSAVEAGTYIRIWEFE